MKRKGLTLISILLILFTLFSVAGTSVFAEENEMPLLTTTEAHSWTALFDRRGLGTTWLGADGIYSVALDGNDSFGSATEDTNTFCVKLTSRYFLKFEYFLVFSRLRNGHNLRQLDSLSKISCVCFSKGFDPTV